MHLYSVNNMREVHITFMYGRVGALAVGLRVWRKLYMCKYISTESVNTWLTGKL